jgi:hypothetical protein
LNRFPLMWQISHFYSFSDFSIDFFTCHSFPERRGDSLTMFIIKRIQNGCEDKANCADIKAKRFCRHYPETHNSQSSSSSVVGRAMTQSPPPPSYSTWLSTSVGRATPGNGRARALSGLDSIPFYLFLFPKKKEDIFFFFHVCVCVMEKCK